MVLQPIKMEKFSIIGLKEDIEPVLHNLQKLGIVEFEPYETELAEKGHSLEKAKEIADLLVKLQGVISAMEPQKLHKVKVPSLDKVIEEAKEIVTVYRDWIDKLEDETDMVSDEIEDLKKFKRRIEVLSSFDIDIGILNKFGLITIKIGEIGSADLNKIRGKFNELEDSVLIENRISADRKVVIFACNVKRSNDLEKLLQKVDFDPIDISEIEGNPKQRLRETTAIIESKERNLSLMKEELKEISRKNYSRASAIYEMLENYYLLLETPRLGAFTEHTFVLVGWVVKDKYPLLKKKLEESFSDIIVSKMEFGESQPPTLMSNPKFVQPFEFLTKLVGVPRYGEFDPTLFLALTFPLFFGIMVGDVAYGVAILLIGLFFKDRIGDLSAPLVVGGITSIIFGLLFGEIFGDLFIHFNLFSPLWIDRLKEVRTLMYYACAVGLIHLNLGFLLGVLAQLPNGLKHILGSLSWFVIEAGVALIAFGFPFPLGLIVFLIGVVMMFLGHGIGGVLEVTSLLGNTLSYTRLLAVGLASAGLAVVINKIALMTAKEGLWPVAALIFICGHAINLILAIMGAFLHGIRLHYVEFFGKFFQSDGKLFQPFSLKKTVMEE